jgi:hypothetical protein
MLNRLIEEDNERKKRKKKEKKREKMKSVSQIDVQFICCVVRHGRGCLVFFFRIAITILASPFVTCFFSVGFCFSDTLLSPLSSLLSPLPLL